jgi:hypothetical protein
MTVALFVDILQSPVEAGFSALSAQCRILLSTWFRRRCDMTLAVTNNISHALVSMAFWAMTITLASLVF